jgi:predicted proteasome-type protease
MHKLTKQERTVHYTIEVYKQDRRTKAGERLINKQDLGDITATLAQTVVEMNEDAGFRVELHETYVTKKNFMSGQEFQERYDTPYYCSASSETYWSN